MLLCCARTRMGDGAEGTARALLRGPIHWPTVLSLAARHRVLPLLYRNLSRFAAADGFPGAVVNELRGCFLDNARHVMFLARELVELMGLFGRHGISAVPFKGPTLAASAYGDMALRSCVDLDVLVRRDDIGRAKALLVSLGHRPGFPTCGPRETDYLLSLTGEREEAFLRSHAEHHFVREGGLVNIDLHWAVALDSFALRPDGEWPWGRLGSVRLAGTDLPQFCVEDLLLILCINGAKEGWCRLDRVCDVAQLIGPRPALGWERLLGQAERLGARRMLLLGLRLAADLLEAAVPAEVRHRAVRDPVVEALAGPARQRLVSAAPPAPADDSTAGKTLFRLRVRDNARDRVRYCLAQLKPTASDRALLPLPDRLRFVHYLVRPIRLAGVFLSNQSGRPPTAAAAQPDDSDHV